MKLFVDEDTGARVARALKELGVDVRHIGGEAHHGAAQPTSAGFPLQAAKADSFCLETFAS